MRVNNATYCSV